MQTTPSGVCTCPVASRSAPQPARTRYGTRRRPRLPFDAISAILRAANISYVKWDMNRYLTEVFSVALPASRQGEVAHRFIMGTYKLLKRITAAFPDVLLESCSGGGGRFDFGMLYYSPQIWTSDNTDAMCRLRSSTAHRWRTQRRRWARTFDVPKSYHHVIVACTHSHARRSLRYVRL